MGAWRVLGVAAVAEVVLQPGDRRLTCRRTIHHQEISSMSERKAAIVTGSGTGVGAATALALARRG
jgi:hypothetical protein